MIVIVSHDCVNVIQAAKQRPRINNFSNSDIYSPTFVLPNVQSVDPPLIPPDVYQDSLLPAVSFVQFSFIFGLVLCFELKFQPLLSRKRGYGTETHHVTTEDGYILGMHRIVSSPRLPRSASARQKPVVFLQHGFLDSSATWLMSGPDHGFGM